MKPLWAQPAAARRPDLLLSLLPGLVRGLVFLGLSGLLVACSQTGDFGRLKQPAPSVFDQRPGLTRQGEPVLVKSSQEIHLDNLLQRFVTDIAGSQGVTAISNSARALAGREPTQSDYYDWLRTQPFADSSTRYRKLANEVDLDTMTLPAVFRAICAVQNLDRRREIAARELAAADPATLSLVVGRRLENNETVARFVAVLEFRYDSYSYALEQLLIETPDVLARMVDTKLNILAVQVQTARAGQFC